MLWDFGDDDFDDIDPLTETGERDVYEFDGNDDELWEDVYE